MSFTFMKLHLKWTWIKCQNIISFSLVINVNPWFFCFSRQWNDIIWGSTLTSKLVLLSSKLPTIFIEYRNLAVILVYPVMKLGCICVGDNSKSIIHHMHIYFSAVDILMQKCADCATAYTYELQPLCVCVHTVVKDEKSKEAILEVRDLIQYRYVILSV